MAKRRPKVAAWARACKGKTKGKFKKCMKAKARGYRRKHGGKRRHGRRKK